MRKPPTIDHRYMERALISANDMGEAFWFIGAALAHEGPALRGDDSIRRALVIAAVIYYARPFTNNELRPKKNRRVARGAPPFPKIELKLSEVLGDKKARQLHRSVLRIRNKMVAHAESRYFPVRLIKSFASDNQGRTGDFNIAYVQTHPKIDLHRLQANAKQLRSAFGFHAQMAAHEVRKTRKRLRRR